MKLSRSYGILVTVLLIVCGLAQVHGATISCLNRGSPCFLKKMTCPDECLSDSPSNSKAKVCYVNCNSPICMPECKNKKPNCNAPGAACLDPRFIGGDGIVFYFHGKSDEHFSLVSDRHIHINAGFIGLRPAGRPRDYTWIQALGILTGSESFSIEAIRAAKWDSEMDHLRFSYKGNELTVPEVTPSTWHSPEGDFRVERSASKNSVVITIGRIAEISVNVVPVTKEDNRIHNYQIPSDDCFAHLEVQFRFFSLSPRVEGVLGRTYQPDFENPAKPGVAMPVVGGEDRYRTSSLLSADCAACIFSPIRHLDRKRDSMGMKYSILDCTGGATRTSGNGIVCRR